MTTVDPLSGFLLTGKRALITGAGGGIGRALVSLFVAAGATVMGADIKASAMDGLELADRLVFDLTDPDAIEKALAPLEGEGKGPDIFISNAGFTRGEKMDQVDRAVWDRELAINLSGAFHVAKSLVAGMVKRGGGSVVFISTVNALAHHGNPAYSAAKAGLLALARAIAVERGGQGVRANVVCPGSVRTPAWDHRFERSPDLLRHILPLYPLQRMVKPEEVARAALFLASEAASGITGAVLPVDAGLTAGNLRFVTDVLGGG